MKRVIFFIIGMVAMMTFAINGQAADFHIGIVTGTISQAEDEFRGAEKLIEEYGSVVEGGMIQHVTYPDNFMREIETTITRIVTLADDPKMKAIVVNQAIPGTSEAFRKVRKKNPNILLIAGETHEDPLLIHKVADLVTHYDYLYRGYLIIHTAKELGCDKFVHIACPKSIADETHLTRKDIMEQACKDLDLQFVFETAPDLDSDKGSEGIRQYIHKKIPALVGKYGRNTAFSCTDNTYIVPLLKELLEHGGYFIEADLPSLLKGYPEALDLGSLGNDSDVRKILKIIEDTVIARGGSGRFGTWVYSYGNAVTAGLVEHAKRVIEDKSELTKLDDIMRAFGKYTPGAKWNGGWYLERETGMTLKNYILLYQDTYILGRGYMGMTEVNVPEKYLK